MTCPFLRPTVAHFSMLPEISLIRPGKRTRSQKRRAIETYVINDWCIDKNGQKHSIVGLTIDSILGNNSNKTECIKTLYDTTILKDTIISHGKMIKMELNTKNEFIQSFDIGANLFINGIGTYVASKDTLFIDIQGYKDDCGHISRDTLGWFSIDCNEIKEKGRSYFGMQTYTYLFNKDTLVLISKDDNTRHKMIKIQ
jgi:hypothetical protein